MSVAVITGTSNLNPLDGHLKPPKERGIVQAVGRRTTFARRPTVTGQIVGRYRDSHRRRRDCMARADSGRIHS